MEKWKEEHMYNEKVPLVTLLHPFSNWSKPGWELQHWKTLQQNYNESQNFKYNKSNT